MFYDEDYGFLTGGLGDLDGDGKVDFTEYMIEEDDFQRIMGNNDDDDFFSDDEEDDDWKDIYTNTADELGLDLDNYFDEDEFLEAVEEVTEDTDDDENKDGDKEYDEEYVIPLKDFDVNKLSLTIGAHTSLDYDGKPIDEVFGNSSKDLKNHNVKSNNSNSASIEKRYYDRQERTYRIGDAIYDNFKEISDNYERRECEDFGSLISKIYKVDKNLGIKIWIWAMKNFEGARVNRGVDEYNSQAWSLTDSIFSNLASIDNEDDNEKERTAIFRYVSKHPELEEIIFNKTYVDDNLFSLTEYIPYCIDNNFRENFLHVYNGIMNNRFRDENKMSKYLIIEKLLTFSNIYGVNEADEWFYAFFEKEIKALNKPLKEAYLMQKLNEENYGGRIFLKPQKENLELDDEYFGKSDTADDISREEYKKLKNENKALKSKVTQLEKRITDLNYNIQRLEADLEAKRKPVKKEWDGKYYRYCQVHLDESRNDLWYRTNDITIKVGDYVFVPYGYKNDEKMGKVVSVEEYRSDALPFPLEKTKSILEKCNE